MLVRRLLVLVGVMLVGGAGVQLVVVQYFSMYRTPDTL
jgi:hypothetical protein